MKAAGDLSIEVGAEGAVPIVTVVGEVDPNTSERLAEALLAAGEGAPARVVVDVAGVSFIDSSGISALLQAWNADGGATTFELRGASDTLRRLLRITNLEGHFDLT